MLEELINIFDEFNSKDVNYFIIRDYYSMERLCDSRDIDIFVDEKYKKSVDKIFKENGWYTPFFNDNKYPHKQYFKMTSNKIIKIDIVFEFCFGKDNLMLSSNIINKNEYNKLESIRIAEERNALYIMVFHVLFDKGELSDKNRLILEKMILEYEKKYKDYDNDIYMVAKKLVKDDINSVNENINLNKIKLSQKLYRNKVKNFFINLRIKIVGKLKYISNCLRKRSICFVGIDGSGKSSTIKSMSDIFDNISQIVYMGQKDYKINKLSILLNKEKCTLFEKILKIALLRIEFFYRYYNTRYNYKIILFDRYIDDNFINASGKFKLLDLFLFKLIFPKPKIKIYLYCSAETSFERKNDILSKDNFITMKNRYDEYYLKRKDCILIDTDKYSEEEVISKIVSVINKDYPYFLI